MAACSTTRNAAPVVDRTPAARPSEVARPKAPEGRGFYTVKRGDTLYRIAQENGQTVRDLVAWNNLASPHDIQVDQVLRVLPAEAVAAPGGAQTGKVAPSGVEVRPLNSQPPGQETDAAQKTGPVGEKLPYSAQALENMQKSQGAIPPQAKVDPRPVDKAAQAAAQAAPPPPAAEGLEWMWPAEGRVIATFDGNRKGIDIAGKMGQPIMAAGSGTVLYASSVRGYGNLVIVKHTNNLLSAYAHNKTILVKEGQSVSKGQKIAEMGNSDSDAVKLHFEIRQQGKPVDPSKFLPSR